MILFTELLRSPAGIMSLIGMLLALAKFGWIIGYFIIKSHEEPAEDDTTAPVTSHQTVSQ